MDEYVSKKDILQMIESAAMWNRSFSVLYEDIEDMKPADVEPARHGKWNDWEVFWKECSCCGYRTQRINVREYFFCPKCGARMDEEA